MNGINQNAFNLVLVRLFVSNFWNAVKLSWKHRNAVGNAKLDGPFSCNRSHIGFTWKCSRNNSIAFGTYDFMYFYFSYFYDLPVLWYSWHILCETMTQHLNKAGTSTTFTKGGRLSFGNCPKKGGSDFSHKNGRSW